MPRLDKEATKLYNREYSRKYYGYKGGVYRAKGHGPTQRERQLGRSGFTLSEYSELCVFGCAICGHKERTLNADHCHKTNLRREVLCRNCNIGLGHFNDDPEKLRMAALYVEAWRVRHAEVNKNAS